ncbi:putative von willebrand factor type a protein [Phaeoacremonium minimum UCRPA7]|uniref:Putative von willebrand factor type a protein n=1 Tax=Phaeoacremonium minimum (strain UCR-PA7) TaxID=1286976 RepID=R8BNF4_PHAM7|nr:putative von willebrand factor type a protein [Phaeoacremonium minimum UCRPA7]EOO00825.1 putative von willebrand factor type a protein [Phaeoacremonium minimum UCRPA7]
MIKMRFILLSHLLLGVASAASFSNHANLIKRDNSQVCSDLTVSSNNGDRKVAIVIDSSGSMVSNDYTDLRIAAGRALNEFLISDSEAKDGKKADEVTVIDFDDEAYLDYPLGDPGNANSSFSKIDSIGGTYITSGVLMAIDQLTSSNSGTTDKRSAIVVFTDGEDYSTDELVSAIGNATALGIRVSFGFLDPYASSQPEEVLKAVRDSRGVYATITFAAGSQNFINYVLLNGLTYNDNPQGYGSQLLAGLAETQFISGSDTVTLKYSAEKNERVNFTITTITAGSLKAEVKMDGKSLGSDTISYYDAFIDVQAPSSGEMQLLVTADGAPKDSMFSVTTNSNVPIKNCTVGVSGSNHSGLSKGAKAGIGIGVTIGILGLLGGAGYFGYKHFFGPGSGNTTAPPAHGNTTSGPTPGNHSQPPTYVDSIPWANTRCIQEPSNQ